MWLQERTLEGEHVILQPLRAEHLDGLIAAVKDGEAWRLWYANVPQPEAMQHYLETAVEQSKSGNIAYAVINKATGKVVGTTRYYQVDDINRRAMIGYTWYANSARRTPINTESKFLLLQQLFEEHDALAVEFRTHSHNNTSRNAIERLGAKQDGIIRNHMILKDGSIRDTVIYSIIAAEWLAVKQNLLTKLTSR